MEDLFYEKLRENEEKVKNLGPHVSGIVNALCNVILYPIFQVSTQLQLSPVQAILKDSPLIAKDFRTRLYSMVYVPNSMNKPFSPPRFLNYSTVVMYNSLQGFTSFYKGFSHATLSFYLPLFSRSLVTSNYYSQLADLSFTERIFAETFMASACEFVFHPLFVAQTRFINQHNKMRTFTDTLDMVKRSGIFSMWRGWGYILPRQFILAAWVNYSSSLDRETEKYLGSKYFYQVFSREVLVGAGGLFISYPLLTAARRVSAYGKVTGMETRRYYGILHALWKIGKEEGVKGLYRGFGCYSFAVFIT